MKYGACAAALFITGCATAFFGVTFGWPSGLAETPTAYFALLICRDVAVLAVVSLLSVCLAVYAAAARSGGKNISAAGWAIFAAVGCGGLLCLGDAPVSSALCAGVLFIAMWGVSGVQLIEWIIGTICMTLALFVSIWSAIMLPLVLWTLLSRAHAKATIPLTIARVLIALLPAILLGAGLYYFSPRSSFYTLIAQAVTAHVSDLGFRAFPMPQHVAGLWRTVRSGGIGAMYLVILPAALAIIRFVVHRRGILPIVTICAMLCAGLIAPGMTPYIAAPALIGYVLSLGTAIAPWEWIFITCAPAMAGYAQFVESLIERV